MLGRFIFVKSVEGQDIFWINTETAKYKGNFKELKTWILENTISSYRELKSKNDWKRLWKEPDFSDLLVLQMKQNRFFDAFPVNREPKEGLGMERDYGYLDIKIDVPLGCGRYFAFECKKLDQKVGKSSLQQEYIDEGLHRFVVGKYAREEDFGGMIGFVIAGEIKKVISDIKERVRGHFFVQEYERLLMTTCVGFSTSFQSRHTRKNNLRNIHIYHLFFDFES